MKKKYFSIGWGDSTIQMLPSKALFLPKTKELLICDVHLGKADYFQKNGIPLTNNSDEQNLLRIKNVVINNNPNKLIILGDLFHSKYSISELLKSKVEHLSESLNIKIELIVGNHDIGCKVKNIKFINYKRSSNFIFSHEPLGKFENNILNICGHYHPKIFLKNSKDKLSFKCFAMDKKNNTLYLPAFGDLTGGYPCKSSFKKWVIVSDTEIIEI
ncbi:Serine/threonine specific protein phosphatase [Prochlorococcus marinus str. MIT 9515]|uniref:Serine/threonine specific protein phosphatase n=1 Tax=Prochlorococcus marinus (strain MIT 9515) TaxID=167542 RepID=A2BWA7_PROM5|nr:ligase-associated DNA damage response endonuclease PdeM [Prochlorococcus marinus]ABM72068.1 Serine/threonine specific protein phosphatase [Prochlorococcus marinus str. MIT 9515]